MKTKSKKDNEIKSKQDSEIVNKSEDIPKLDQQKCLVCSKILISRMKAVEHILKDHSLKIDKGDSISKYIELNLYQDC